jgi:hypothetical protein
MKLLQIALSLLLVLSLIACASTHKVTPDAISKIKYGMEFSEVQKALGSQGDLVLRWVKGGENYFVNRYYVKKTYRSHCMVFKDDVFVAFIQGYKFDEVFEKHVVPPVGKLPFEDGYEPLYTELVAQKYKFPQIEVHEIAKDSKDYKFPYDPSGSIELELLLRPSLGLTLGPLILGNSIYNRYDTTRSKDYKLQKKFNKLSIGTSKETVIEFLGQPELSRKSIESDYEILIYSNRNSIGIRDGKIEWTFKGVSGYQLYRQLDELEEGKKTPEDNE